MTRVMAGRRARGASGALLVSALLAMGAAGCTSGAEAGSGAPTPTAVPSDPTTRRIAQVEFLRQCTVDTTVFPKESDVAADLEKRLAGQGLTQPEWKAWHDALANSPQLVTQLAEVSRGGCPPS